MTPVDMPKANENMAEATLQDWIVKEGDVVAEKDSLCVIITDKATFEMPSPAAGTIRKILGAPRSVLPVGYTLCLIGDAGEEVAETYAERNRALLEAHRGTVVASPDAGTPKPVQSGTPGPRGGKIRATPAARRAAKQAGVTLEAIRDALGITGVIGEKDVQAFLAK